MNKPVEVSEEASEGIADPPKLLDRVQEANRTRHYSRRTGATLSLVKLVTGRVENGKVTLPEGEFEEGAAVAVLASTMDEPVRLTPAEEEALIESLAAIRSGNYISSEDLLRQMRLRGR